MRNSPILFLDLSLTYEDLLGNGKEKEEDNAK